MTVPGGGAAALPEAEPGAGGAPAGPQIGFGRVRHTRLRPVRHAFAYRSYFLMLPLRSLRHRPAPLLSRNRFGLLAFHDADHGDGGPDALAWMDELLASEGVDDVGGEMWLQTYPRVLGFAFKPVSFWYAHRRDGALAAVVAEVNNTFGERHCYLLRGPALSYGCELAARKVLHVSPFCQVAGEYRFRFLRTAQHCMARVDHHDGAGALLSTSLGGRLEPLTPASRHRAFFTLPLMTLGVVALIHWQALRLWLRRVPWFRKPAAPPALVSGTVPGPTPASSAPR
jgi:DUF1365 family protein